MKNPESLNKFRKTFVTTFLNNSYPLIVRYRRSIAASLVAVSAALLISVVTSDNGSGVPVLVATKQLAAGSTLTQSDFKLSELHDAALWATVIVEPTDVIGRTISRSLEANQPISSNDVVGPGLLEGMPENFVAISLPLTSGTNTLMLNVGSPIDIYTISNDGLNTGILVASRAIVLAKPGKSSGSMLSNDSQGSAIIIGVDSVAAIGIAGNMNNQGFTVAVLQ